MEAIEALLSRRSAVRLGEPPPDEATLDLMLRAAMRAPDHGRLRPWRFVLLLGDARKRFGDIMAEARKRSEPTAAASVINHEREKPLRAPLIVVVVAAIKNDHAIPSIEQLLSAGAAAENLLIAAHALGYGAAWKTGFAAYDDDVKRALGLAPTDAIVGFIYLGTPIAPRAALPPDERSDFVQVWTG